MTVRPSRQKKRLISNRLMETISIFAALVFGFFGDDLLIISRAAARWVVRKLDTKKRRYESRSLLKSEC